MGSTKALQGKLAVVTGGSRGLGRFIARELAGAGADVVITGRDEKSLQAAARSIGERASWAVCDQTDANAIRLFASGVLEKQGAPAILVNNAGALPRRWVDVVDLSEEDWRRVIDTNLTGVFLMTRAFLPSMIAKGEGEIVMIASTSGLRADAGSSAYNASKFGLRGFSEALTREVRRHGLRVTVLSPSSIDMSEPAGAVRGKGVKLHASDLARTVLHVVTLPGRTLVREVEVWGTDP